MTYSSPYRFTPGLTPEAVKNLIIATGAISLFAALVNNFFTYVFNAPGPQDWLSLSWHGVRHLYIWQFVSFLFVQYSGFNGINFNFLINLTFNLYALWILGTIVQERVGNGPFLRLYFLSGIFAGAAALLCMAGGSLAGATPSLLALLVVWTMLHPNSEILLFFLIPVRTKWLAAGALAAICLVSLSQLNLAYFVFAFAGALFGYLYALAAWNLEGPFPITHRFDHFIAALGIKARSRWSKQKGPDVKKIIQFPLTDDQFVDAMLQKISKHGEGSLSWSERRRLDQISRSRDKH